MDKETLLTRERYNRTSKFYDLMDPIALIFCATEYIEDLYILHSDSCVHTDVTKYYNKGELIHDKPITHSPPL